MIKSKLKELSKEEFEKLSDEEKIRYTINKVNRMEVIKKKDEDKEQ